MSDEGRMLLFKLDHLTVLLLPHHQTRRSNEGPGLGGRRGSTSPNPSPTRPRKEEMQEGTNEE